MGLYPDSLLSDFVVVISKYSIWQFAANENSIWQGTDVDRLAEVNTFGGPEVMGRTVVVRETTIL
jgi:hypothetical protein